MNESDKTRGLISVSHHVPERKETHINDILQDCIELYKNEFENRNIDLIKELDRKCPPIMADSSMLAETFVNIIVNAFEAIQEIPRKGYLKISTQLDGKHKVIRIKFEDNADGIDEEQLSKIFDIEFSTKRKGIGVGLAIAEKIVRDHGGTISAMSKKGEGAIFTIELPLETLPPIIPKKEKTLPPELENLIRIEKKNVLVIHDDLQISDDGYIDTFLVKNILEMSDHRIEEANDLDSAIRKIEEIQFDAVISTLKMPEKDGIKLYLYCRDKIPVLTKRFLFIIRGAVTPKFMHLKEEYDIEHILMDLFGYKEIVHSITHLLQGSVGIRP